MDQILKEQDKALQLIYSTLVRNYEIIYTFYTEAVDQLQI